MYHVYVPDTTISLPDDVVPIIDNLGVPFSRWVTDQLRRNSAQTTTTFAQQFVTDAALATGEPPTEKDALATAERMERSAPW